VKKISIYFLFLFILTLTDLSIASAETVPLSWDGVVGALNGKSDYSHYEFKITNMSVEYLGDDYYNATINVLFRKCTLVENGTPTKGCPVKKKRISFIVKENTNTFILNEKPAFFFLYWPNFSTDKSVYHGQVRRW
jgi:hypothetical protein